MHTRAATKINVHKPVYDSHFLCVQTNSHGSCLQVGVLFAKPFRHRLEVDESGMISGSSMILILAWPRMAGAGRNV